MKTNRFVYAVSAAVLAWFSALSCAPWKEEELQREADEARAEATLKRMKKSEMKNPWARAKVGDWILLRVPGSRRHRKIEVIKANDIEVMVDSGQGEGEDRFYAYNLEEEEKRYKEPEEIEGFVKKVEKVENIGGKMINCIEYTLSGQGNTIVNTISKEAPLDGMVKAVRNDEVTYQVIDFQKN